MDVPTDSPDYHRNPSPPPELTQNKELDLADKVGQSAFSKHWIFSTLMKLIQKVDNESEKPEADQCELGIDVNEELQNELCELWDMSMNKDVAEFLHEFKAMDILGGVIRKSKAPRVVEICVGILGNMVCTDRVCVAVSKNSILVDLLLALLDSRDPQTLVETFRLCYVCLCNSEVSDIWLKAVKDNPESQTNLKFVFQSSTNVDLLKKAAEYLDKLLELDDNLCQDWANQEMVEALLEGVQQIGYTHSEELEVYLHVFELLSTTEEGVEALVSECAKVEVQLKKYLEGVCEYEIVGLDGRERCLCSALAVLNVVFSSSPEFANSIIDNEQYLRYFLKILEPLSRRIDHLREKTISTENIESTKSANSIRETNFSEATDDLIGGKPQANGDNHSVTNDDNRASSKNCEKYDPSEEKVHKESEDVAASDSRGTDNKYLLLLFDILQGLLHDIVCYLHSVMPEQVAEEEGLTVPAMLEYLNTMCTRDRVKCLITTLEMTVSTSEDADSVVKLSDMAQRFQLRRLSDIIDNIPLRHDSVCVSDTDS